MATQFQTETEYDAITAIKHIIFHRSGGGEIAVNDRIFYHGTTPLVPQRPGITLAGIRYEFPGDAYDHRERAHVYDYRAFATNEEHWRGLRLALAEDLRTFRRQPDLAVYVRQLIPGEFGYHLPSPTTKWTHVAVYRLAADNHVRCPQVGDAVPVVE